MTRENTLAAPNPMHIDLMLAKELAYDKCGLCFSNFKQNKESAEYGACSFQLNNKTIQYRIAKITPTKTGQFVTIWKRNKDGNTAPFDFSDDLDFVIITTRHDNNIGQFIFPKMVLAENGIITRNNKEGKRGIRVYPPWDKATNKQAEKTQSWQTKYFFNIQNDSSIDLDWVMELFE